LSQQLRNDQHLTEEIRVLLRAVEQNPACIVITNRDGNIEYVNPKFTELTGYTLDEVLGRNTRILKSEKNPPNLYAEFSNKILSGNTWHGELYYRKRNGELSYTSASISPVLNDEGVISHFVEVKGTSLSAKELKRL
jgi:PAS domain S-box-containing protein